MATRSLWVQGGPPSPVASWLNITTRAKRHRSSAVSNPLPPGYETDIIPLDHRGTKLSFRTLKSVFSQRQKAFSSRRQSSPIACETVTGDRLSVRPTENLLMNSKCTFGMTENPVRPTRGPYSSDRKGLIGLAKGLTEEHTYLSG